jgi:hypothetical protein
MVVRADISGPFSSGQDGGPDHLYHLWLNCIKSLNVHPPRSEMLVGTTEDKG